MEMTNQEWNEYHASMQELAQEACVNLGIIEADDSSTYDSDSEDPLTAMLEDIKGRTSSDFMSRFIEAVCYLHGDTSATPSIEDVLMLMEDTHDVA